MLVTPYIPRLSSGLFPDTLGSWASFPMRVEVSSLVLVVLTVLVGIFIAAVTVILLYHWRRFPFELETFRSAERIYLMGVTILLAIAVIGILITSS